MKATPGTDDASNRWILSTMRQEGPGKPAVRLDPVEILWADPRTVVEAAEVFADMLVD